MNSAKKALRKYIGHDESFIASVLGPDAVAYATKMGWVGRVYLQQKQNRLDVHVHDKKANRTIKKFAVADVMGGNDESEDSDCNDMREFEWKLKKTMTDSITKVQMPFSVIILFNRFWF